MFTLTVTLDSAATYIAAADIVALLSYVLYLFNKKRNLEKSIKTITDFITDYFMHTGAEVQVSCFKLDGDNRFVTLIESQPLKRFRFSNILESNLIAHIYKTTGNKVEKIYWRFPVAIHNEAMVSEEQRAQESEDLYFADVKAVSEANTMYKVSEASWDEFKDSK